MFFGGLWWFACIVSGFTAYAPNSGGDLWWFAVMCGGFGFFRWFVVVCRDFSHTLYITHSTYKVMLVNNRFIVLLLLKIT